MKMITLRPAILGLAIEKIRGRIADLSELGFADAVKMIKLRPPILETWSEICACAAGMQETPATHAAASTEARNLHRTASLPISARPLS
jgi:hypothetical protein